MCVCVEACQNMVEKQEAALLNSLQTDQCTHNGEVVCIHKHALVF